MGREWYDDGKLLNKKNTFTDFIDVTDCLVKEGYAAKDRVAAMGGSAGGLLMGAIANMAPENYRVILSQVPFVDVVTTMLDPSIPLTTNEYDEWGNPEEKEYYDYMLTLFAVRQPADAGLSGDVRRHRPVGFAGAVLGAGQVRGPAARPQHRHASRWCSAPTWKPATAASPAASAATARRPRCTPSCWTSWAWPSPRPTTSQLVAGADAWPRRRAALPRDRGHGPCVSLIVTAMTDAFAFPLGLVAAGLCQPGLGIVGIVRAGPADHRFVLVAAYAASRGSERLHRYLLTAPALRPDDPRLAGRMARSRGARKWAATLTMLACAAMLLAIMVAWRSHRWWMAALPIACMALVAAVAVAAPGTARR